VIEDYLYARINFSRDIDMPVPPREERGEIGTCILKLFYFYFILYISFFMCIRVFDNYVYVMYKCGTSAPNRLRED
jgi:hypothetical protein